MRRRGRSRGRPGSRPRMRPTPCRDRPGPLRRCHSRRDVTASRSRKQTAAWSPPGSPRWMPSWGRADCPVTRPSRSGGRRRRAARPSRCGWLPRHRPPARSWPGWTLRACSTRWRRSPAGSAPSGWWSWLHGTWRRRSPWRVRCSPREPWTSWWWTSRREPTRRSPASGWVTGSAGSQPSPGAQGRCWWCWSRSAWAAAWPVRSKRPAGSGSRCGVPDGSTWAGTLSVSGAPWRWPATGMDRRAAARRSRSSTRRAGPGMAASSAPTCWRAWWLPSRHRRSARRPRSPPS